MPALTSGQVLTTHGVHAMAPALGYIQVDALVANKIH